MTALPFSISLCDEINLLRQNPPAYAVHIQAHLDRFIDDYIYKKPTGSKIRTKEGVKTVRLTIEALKTVAPLAPLTPCAELEQAALDHANDTELKGLIGHVGSDGSFTPDRIKRYGNWAVQVGENLRYGNDNPRDAVVAWLIDDGRVARGHRKNLLNPDFTYLGAAIGGHEKYGTCVVASFAHSFSA